MVHLASARDYMVCMEHLASASISSAADKFRPEPRGGSNSEAATNSYKTIQATQEMQPIYSSLQP